MENKPTSKKKPKFFGYKVHVNSRCTNSYREKKAYGDWREEHENEFEGVSSAKDYPDCVSTVDLSVEKGYLVWAESSTGDSFGRSSRSELSYIAILRTQSDAQKVQDALEKWTNDYDPNDSSGYGRFTMKIGDQHIETTLPWGGYFESLDCVHIEVIDHLKNS